MIQCLYLVFGGELVDLIMIVFKDINDVYFVGLFFDYELVYDVWKVNV